MIATTAGALPGVRLVHGAADTPVGGVVIDSREVRPGDLFVAIRGGHAFTGAARDAGAAAVLVEEAHAAGEPAAGVVLAARDTVEALAAIGAANAAAATRCTVVGVTGSSGKTSTKDALAAVLGRTFRVVASASSHNNEIGVPLTLCRIGPHDDVAVCEMAMRGPGQIAALAAIAGPRVAVVTNVGTAHLGMLGSRRAIAEAKAELVTALPDDGVAVLPHDEPLLAEARRAGLRVLEFGEGDGPDVALVARVARPGGQQARFRVGEAEIEVALPVEGRHQALNVAAALAVAHALGVPLADAAAGAAGIRLQRWRGEAIVLPGGAVVLNEAYNANPASLGAALEALGERAVGSRRIAVLGEMAELGDEGPELHRTSGRQAAERGVTVLVAVGDAAAAYLEGAGPDVEGHRVADAAAAIELLAGLVRPADAVLVKGSRSAGLEGVAEGLAGRLTNRSEP